MENKIITKSPKSLARAIKDSAKNGKRFCFVLGSGASKASGIPTGIELAKKWRKEIDANIPKDELDQVLKHFEIKLKDISVKNNNLASANYENIYKVRFIDNYGNGTSALDEAMKDAKPSYGYFPLARFLVDENLNSNLVLTTNFDSLTEDALFYYTDKKPLVVSHESLVGFMNFAQKRPIVAKIHRSIMCAPVSDTDAPDTQDLMEKWKSSLQEIFKTYIHIVIGYNGGDHTLMDYLVKHTDDLDGIYWCYRQCDGEPEEKIKNLVSRVHKNQKEGGGFFVKVDYDNAFDHLMFAIGTEFGYKNATEYLEKEIKARVDAFKEQEKKIKEEIDKAANDENATEAQLVAKTDIDNYWQEQVAEYTKKIEENTEDASAYNSRGVTYVSMGEHEKALTDYSKAIELNPNCAVAYSNRGVAYGKIDEYEKALEDYSKAIELDPLFDYYYINRGEAYRILRKYNEALKDFTKALEIEPYSMNAYHSRSIIYRNLGKPHDALKDANKAIELNPNHAEAHNNRGLTYQDLDEIEKAIEDFDKAIELDSKVADFYRNRAIAYEKLGKPELAAADRKKAAELENNEK
ncbi:MAG: tetratricopeptide repeat protein [Oscillospiraceae bacterium]|jgi:tetratricopeptide (TPR) repeat protein|nr:tetratricopeptide repeat protein [Oscillospiraceae bacterium]